MLSRDKFARRLEVAGLPPQGIVADLRRLASLVAPADVPRVILADPDDDHVLACSVAARAELIVSGDRQLLDLGGNYRDIRIVSPAEALSILWG